MWLSGAEIIVKFLEQRNVKVIAGIPGGMILPLYDALSLSQIHHILCRHEQGAGFLAQGIARSTGQAAVCLATSGPGVTNLLTAIADAKMDSVPLVAITGQINYSQIGTDAFQEVDTYGLTLPITKHNFLVRSAKELLRILPEAFDLAECGRPGPVIIDVPKDVQLEKIRLSQVKWPERQKYNMPETACFLPQAPEMLKATHELLKAQKPVLFVGGGVIQAGADALVQKLAQTRGIPVLTTLMGLGAYPGDDPLFAGLTGMHGTAAANQLLHEADLIIALGVRFGDRATGNVHRFGEHAAILHFDIDPAEVNKNKEVFLSLIGDLKHTLGRWLAALPDPTAEERQKSRSWIFRLNELKQADHQTDRENPFHPLNLIRHLSTILPEDAIITTDVGQHQMWTAQSYPFKHPRTFLTSGGLGTMGFGLPSALGAALAQPEKTIVCISGDGSILMNLQELATLAELQANVKVLIFNNGQLGMVRQIQHHFYAANYTAVHFQCRPDFAQIARGFGLEGFTLDLEADRAAFTLLHEVMTRKGPALIDVQIAPDLNVLPIVPPGSPNHHAIGGLNL